MANEPLIQVRNLKKAFGNHEVLSVISVSELFFSGETIAGQSFQFFHTYLIVSGIYLIMTFTISRLFSTAKED